MKTRLFLFLLIILCLVIAAMLTNGVSLRAMAQPLADVLSIPWWTVDNGGGVSQGGPYQISGTAGQPDAVNSAGGTYNLNGGFWSGSVYFSTRLPLVSRVALP
jgi:hypothetical protein